MRSNGRHTAATGGSPLPLFLALSVLAPAVGQGQAVPRTDTPRAGTFRVTFEPVITTWEREFTTGGHEQPIGASLFSETHPAFSCTRVTGFQLDSTGNLGAPGAAQRLDAVLADTTYAFGPIANTTRRLRFFAGDVELQGKYRLLETRAYALSGAIVVRLPTGHQDSPNDLFDLSTGDHQTDIEIQVAQELTLFERLWLNGMVRLARQQPGTRARRVGPQSTLLLPHASLATLAWDPGDYAAVDVAPMLRLAKHFGVGVTAGYWTQQRDHYSYRSPQDSIDVATRLGAPVSASVLDAGTGVRRTRLGVAMTYLGSDVEGSLSFEQTVSAAGGLVPVATVFRIVMRTSRWPF